MNEKLEAIKKLIDESSSEDRQALKAYLGKLVPHAVEREWEVDADTILGAIERSSDLTKRGVRGVIAEAVFVNSVIPTVSTTGWEPVEIEGDHPYDALLQKNQRMARIQVKLQRSEEGAPKLYHPSHYAHGTLFVVEVQKTRSGIRKGRKKLRATDDTATVVEEVSVKTRPYRFGDFDILAVNMHPSTRNWKNFRFTVASWLIPRSSDESLIETLQPVAATPNQVWTDDLSTVLAWFENAENKKVLEEILHVRKPAGSK